MLDFFKSFCANWGDCASVLGLLVSLVGFAITLVAVFRSKQASQLAQEAVAELKERLTSFDTVSSLTQAISIMDEIKRLHRANAWVGLPDRYAVLRRLLMTIRVSNPQLKNEDVAALTGALTQLTDIERKVERAILKNVAPPNVALLNQIVSEQADKFGAILAELRLRQSEQ